MKRFSNSSRASCSESNCSKSAASASPAAGCGAASGEAGSWVAVMTSPGAMITSRSMVLRSSRTLPGHGSARSAATASAASVFSFLPYSAEMLATKWRASTGDVVAPLAQRRDDERDDVEAEEQVLAEASGADLLGQVLVGGGDDAHVHRHALRPAHRLDALLLEHAQHLGLGLEGHVADLVEEQACPPSASSNLPLRAASAPVKAPLVWPNSSLSIRSSGMAAQFTSTKGPAARRLRWWMLRATSSLPVPFSP